MGGDFRLLFALFLDDPDALSAHISHGRYVFHGRIPSPNKKERGGGKEEREREGEGGEQGETRVN